MGMTHMSTTATVLGSSPGATAADKARGAALRALRTLLQGVAAAFPAAGPGSALLGTSYWQTFGYSCLAALITAGVSFLNNVATFLPEDPTQRVAPPQLPMTAGALESTPTT